MNTADHKTAGYIGAMNAFRGFASLYVVLYHLRYYSDFDWFGAFPVLRFGYIGVDFFFILSGLIVSHVYLRKSANAPPDFWKKFIWYRIARLFPVHFLIMLLMLAAYGLGPTLSGSGAALDAQQYWDWFLLTTLVRQWTLPADYAWNSPAWSVSAEFFAYLVIFPLVTRLAPKNLNFRTGLVLIATGALLLAMMIWAAGTVNVKQYAAPLIRVSGGFLIGSGLYVILSLVQSGLDWDRMLGRSLAGLLICFILAPVLSMIGLPVDILLIAALAITVSMAYLAHGPIARWLSGPKLFWLGEVSFALYLCHIPMMRVCAFVAAKMGWQQGFVFGILCLLISVGAAHLLYIFVELPTRGLMRGWYDRYATSRQLSTSN